MSPTPSVHVIDDDHVIAVSGMSEDQLRLLQSATGAAGIMTKPFTLEALEACVRNVTGHLSLV